MAQKCNPKPCVACESVFTPTSRNQKRCVTCKENNVREGKPPLCKCGCGSEVCWGRRRNNWNEFVQGHHLKHFYNNVEGNPLSHPNYNKGNITYYTYVCSHCGIEFRHQHKEVRFCSRVCYHAWNKGENHPNWSGGKVNGGYKFDLD